MILIALGANLPSAYGGPEDTLLAARDALIGKGLNVTAFSGIWLTAPVPVSDQPWYRNAVLSVETSITAPHLMALLQSVEADFGRVRDAHNRNAARVLDLDILSYNDAVIDDVGLSVPHPRMHQRAFVLYPLRDIAPEWTHPVLKQSVANLIDALPAEQEIVRADSVAA